MELIEYNTTVKCDGIITIPSRFNYSAYYSLEEKILKNKSNKILSHQTFPLVKVQVNLNSKETEFYDLPISHLWSLKTGDCIKFTLHHKLRQYKKNELNFAENLLFDFADWILRSIPEETPAQIFEKCDRIESILINKLQSEARIMQYKIDHKKILNRTLILQCEKDELFTPFEASLKNIIQRFTSQANLTHMFNNNFLAWELVGNDILYNTDNTNQYVYGENGFGNKGFLLLLQRCQMLNQLSFSSKECWKKSLLLLCFLHCIEKTYY